MANSTISDNDPLVPSSEARKQLGCICSSTFFRWKKSGLIKLTCINGRHYARQSEIDRIKDGGAGSRITTPPGAKHSNLSSETATGDDQ